MCGFVGFVDIKNKYNFQQSKNIALNMVEAIAHRGPDDTGFWIDKDVNITLAFKRLSIQDISKAGNQPMQSQCGRYIIVFNGEIYNFMQLRTSLIKKGYFFNGRTDTEVILNSFLEWGVEESIKNFIGMFAFVVWDKKTRNLFLVRDRIGEKPLYYGWQNNIFLFGSELKALKKHPMFLGEINRQSIALQVRYSSIPAPNSIYKNIFKLNPGSLLSLDMKDISSVNKISKPKYYWSIDKKKENINKNKINVVNVKNTASELESLLTETIENEIISDVPLGAFLSSGIDSSLIVALMQKISKNKIKTFSIGFDDKKFNEALFSKKIASHLKTEHTELYINSDQALNIIPYLPRIYDEPFSDVSQIPTFILSRLAKENVSVALTGDGGDEVFGGYNRYKYGPLIYNKIKNIPTSILELTERTTDLIPKIIYDIISNLTGISETKEKLQKITNIINEKDPISFYKSIISNHSKAKDCVLIDECNEYNEYPYLETINSFSLEEQMMFWDLTSYLPNNILVKLDRAAMFNSLETRAPFLNHKVVEYGFNLPLNLKIYKGQTKWILKQLLYKYIPSEMLNRPKSGFSVPLAYWLNGPLRDWAENLLDSTKLKNDGLLNHRIIEENWLNFKNKNHNYHYHLWDILMFQAWLEMEKNET